MKLEDQKPPNWRLNLSDSTEILPSQGFSSDSSISAASSSVSYVEDDDEDTGLVVANKLISEGEIVVVEKPYVMYLNATRYQCYHCLKETAYLIPCFECQGAFYCTCQCRLQDWKFHKYECNGQRMLFFTLVDVQIELRLLVKAMDIFKHMKNSVAVDQKFDRAVDYYNILIAAKQRGFQTFFNIYDFEVNYDRLSNHHFNLILSRTEKLLVYLKNFTTFMADYFEDYDTKTKVIDAFVAGVIMRFAGISLLKANLISYEIFPEMAIGGYSMGQRQVQNTQLSTAEKTIKEIHMFQKSKQDSTFNCEDVRWAIFHYANKRSESSTGAKPKFDPLRERDWNRKNYEIYFKFTTDMARKDAETEDEGDIILEAIKFYCRSFYNHFKHFPSIKPDNKVFEASYKAIYPTIMKFSHSCVPNLFAV